MAQGCVYGGRECDGCMNCTEEKEVINFEDWYIREDGLEEDT